MRSTQIPGLFLVTHPEKGRCVHTAEEINKNDLIEVCPVISFSKNDLKKIHKTALHDYYFLWGKNLKKGAIALGYGSIYNHSSKPNAAFEIDIHNGEVRFYALKKIKSGDEICISYTDKSKKDVKLWFVPK